MNANTICNDLLKPGTCGAAELEMVLSEIDLLLADQVDAPEIMHTKIKVIREKYRILAESSASGSSSKFVFRVIRIITKFDEPIMPVGPTWSDLYEAQRIRLRLLSPVKLVFEIAELRGHFQLTAGPALKKHYQQVLQELKNGDGKQESKEGSLRAEASFLLEQCQYIQTYRPHQERKRLTITFNILNVTFWAVVISWLIAVVLKKLNVIPGVPFLWILVWSFGGLGACFSAMQRIQDTFKEGRMILNSTRYMRKLKDHVAPPITGAVFATVLVLIFYSGMAEKIVPFLVPSNSHLKQDDLTQEKIPTPVVTANSNPKGDTTDFENLTYGRIPLQDLARILILAFMAGFAERLVPDTLDRIAGEKTPRKADADAEL